MQGAFKVTGLSVISVKNSTFNGYYLAEALILLMDIRTRPMNYLDHGVENPTIRLLTAHFLTTMARQLASQAMRNRVQHLLLLKRLIHHNGP